MAGRLFTPSTSRSAKPDYIVLLSNLSPAQTRYMTGDSHTERFGGCEAGHSQRRDTSSEQGAVGNDTAASHRVFERGGRFPHPIKFSKHAALNR
ncbi:hypothetical protein E2C01_063091 [Portunus trituberculatus]|uniref:Uncharacterized protein n=1 Tax=Portunus trituberculatus TaxID=210409 RepID=A0A5B7H8A2_PORTR|nr:hypothetical protein [Portunus trituberculatus]